MNRFSRFLAASTIAHVGLLLHSGGAHARRPRIPVETGPLSIEVLSPEPLPPEAPVSPPTPEPEATPLPQEAPLAPPEEALPPAPPEPPADHPAPAPPPGAESAPVLAEGNPPPRYPEEARQKGIEGRLKLRVEVLPDGSAGAVEVLESSGSKILDEAASRAARQWRFRPARIGELATRGSIDIPVRFVLKDR